MTKLVLPEHILEYLNSQGFTTLYPPQEDCIRMGLLDGASLLVSAPTASGKTLIAILAMLSYLSKHGGKVVYLSPLRALAAEKFEEFKKIDEVGLGRKIRVSISTGDFDVAGKTLENSDILILTNERMDSLIRHDVSWLSDIGLVISDEIHLIGDKSRGPALEMVLTHLKLSETNPQIVGLSATITNSDQIADWLGCRLVKNNWRPVPLREGISHAGTVTMDDCSTFEFEHITRNTPVDLGIQSVMDGGQSLIFAETRSRSKSLAAKAASQVSKCLQKSEIKQLQKVSRKILSDNEPTDLVRTLAELVRQGVAFHHAGLNQNCRKTIESEFRSGAIKLLSSTPTLAAGVNLPARRVVISKVTRYNAQLGKNMQISILEYKQLCGRAGRPQFDDYGESIIVGDQYHEELFTHYIHGEPEPIESRIIGDGLRIHVLSVIVTSPGMTVGDITAFFMQTLGGLQSRTSTVKFHITTFLRFLSSNSFIEKNGEHYTATRFGTMTSMLYIDPLTAVQFMDAVKDASRGTSHSLGFLHVISSCDDFFPQFSLRSGDHGTALHILENHSSETIKRLSEYDFSRSLLALQYWITESSELSLSDDLGIESGDMYRMAESAERLAYCLREMARLAGRTDLLGELDSLRTRIRYGINEELVDLVRVRGIGRIRARILYRGGIKDIAALSKVSEARLAGMGKIGIITARKIKTEIRRIRN